MNPVEVYNQELVKSPAPYRGILLELWTEDNEFYYVRMWKDNLADFPTHKQQEIVKWFDNFAARMTKRGVPTGCWLVV